MACLHNTHYFILRGEPIIRSEALKKHMKDIIEYRTMEYYRRRYREAGSKQ